MSWLERDDNWSNIRREVWRQRAAFLQAERSRIARESDSPDFIFRAMECAALTAWHKEGDPERLAARRRDLLANQDRGHLLFGLSAGSDTWAAAGLLASLSYFPPDDV